MAATLAAALAACAAPPPPKENFYRLSIIQPATAFTGPVLPGVLEVGRPDTDGVLADRALAYQLAGGAVARYSYDLWSDAPAELIQEALAQSLRGMGAAAQVVTPDLRVPPDWALRGRLSRFEYLPDAGKVVMRLQLSVVSAHDGTLVLLNGYESEQPVQPAGPGAAVAALGRATSDIVARFAADLGKATIPTPRHP